MSATMAEFRHDFGRFRCFRLFQHQGVFSVCMVVGRSTAMPEDTRRWLSGDRKVAFARDMSNSGGRETWRHNLDKDSAKVELKRWRTKCSREGLREEIVLS